MSIGVLPLAACPKPEPKSETAATDRPVRNERLELQIAAPGMSVADVETMIVQPIEASMISLSTLKHLTGEASEGRGRFVLEFATADVDAARAEIVKRMTDSLPADVGPPELIAASGPTPLRVRWYLRSETLDLLSLAKLHDRLVARSEAIAGVLAVEGCVPRHRVIVELDPVWLRARGLDSLEVVGSIEHALIERPDMDALHSIAIQLDAGLGALTLADVAVIRHDVAEPECLAATANGFAASASVTVDGSDALIAVSSMLDDAAHELPTEVELRRFGPRDTLLGLSFDASVTLEQAVALIVGGPVADPPNWLIEVGVESEPCVGAGMRGHLSVPGPPESNRGLAESLWAVPGVIGVDLLGGPPERRLWLLGPELDPLVELAWDLQRELDGLSVHAHAPQQQLHINYDRDALARLGISMAEVAERMKLASGVELGSLRDADGTAIPLVVRISGGHEDLSEGLGELMVGTGERAVPLSMVAKLEMRRAAARVCRWDARRGIMLTVRADALDSMAIERHIQSRLPPDSTWAWADAPRL